METKFNEEIYSTADLQLMRERYLAKRLLRTWLEDFVDEDTGKVVTIDRNELIYDKGTKLGNDELTVINFHLQAGDIEEVLVSNQQRTGSIGVRNSAVWQVTASYNNKKYNLYLYSNSVEKTKEIANDYLEQLVKGFYSIIGVKELDYSTLVPEDFWREEDLDGNPVIDIESNYYKIEVAIVDENFERKENFIVNAKDAEQGKEIIIKFLLFNKAKQSEQAEDYKIDETLVTIISAKTIPCDYVINYEFSLEYLKDADEA